MPKAVIFADIGATHMTATKYARRVAINAGIMSLSFLASAWKTDATAKNGKIKMMRSNAEVHAGAPSGLNVGLGRTFSPLMLKIWGNDILRAEMLVSGEIQTGGIDSGYEVKLDPEDFLDLCAGKWHES
jgi:hypothetical protein